MIINFFINAIRSLRKLSGYLLLNILGFAIGLTSFIFISNYVVHELSFDRFHQNYENIYHVKVVGRMSVGVLNQAITAAPMAQTNQPAHRCFSVDGFLKHVCDFPYFGLHTCCNYDTPA